MQLSSSQPAQKGKQNRLLQDTKSLTLPISLSLLSAGTDCVFVLEGYVKENDTIQLWYKARIKYAYTYVLL